MRIAKEALEQLRTYPWPGNVRELDNEIARAVALAYTIPFRLLTSLIRCSSIRGTSQAVGNAAETV
jgi:DNA-binding NtrC family response regulator